MKHAVKSLRQAMLLLAIAGALYQPMMISNAMAQAIPNCDLTAPSYTLGAAAPPILNCYGDANQTPPAIGPASACWNTSTGALAQTCAAAPSAAPEMSPAGIATMLVLAFAGGSVILRRNRKTEKSV